MHYTRISAACLALRLFIVGGTRLGTLDVEIQTM